MRDVLNSIKPVIKTSEFVLINDKAIDSLVDTFKSEEFEKKEFNESDSLLQSSKEEDHIGFTIVYNTVNFCYWGEPKWTIIENLGFYFFAILYSAHKAISNHAVLRPTEGKAP